MYLTIEALGYVEIHKIDGTFPQFSGTWGREEARGRTQGGWGCVSERSMKSTVSRAAEGRIEALEELTLV